MVAASESDDEEDMNGGSEGSLSGGKGGGEDKEHIFGDVEVRIPPQTPEERSKAAVTMGFLEEVLAALVKMLPFFFFSFLGVAAP